MVLGRAPSYQEERLHRCFAATYAPADHRAESATEFTMPEPTPTDDRADGVTHAMEYDQFASYEDGDAIVICDRRRPQAWIRSDAVVGVRQ